MRLIGWMGAVAVVLLLGSGVPARAAEETVKIEKSEKHGKYLTDGKGRALYFFKKDSKGKSACTGACVDNWPIFHAENVAPRGEDLKAADFESITREDGKKQTTYQGKPLYYFVKDTKPGETTGDGVKDVWELAKP